MEFATAVFTQSLHALILRIALQFLAKVQEFGTPDLTDASNAFQNNPELKDKSILISFLCIIFLTAITRFEKVIKQFFGIGSSSFIGDVGRNGHKAFMGAKSALRMGKNLAAPVGAAMKGNKTIRGMKNRIDKGFNDGTLQRQTKRDRFGNPKRDRKGRVKTNGYITHGTGMPAFNSVEEMAKSGLNKIDIFKNAIDEVQNAQKSYDAAFAKGSHATKAEKERARKNLDEKAHRYNMAYKNLGENDEERDQGRHDYKMKYDKAYREDYEAKEKERQEKEAEAERQRRETERSNRVAQRASYVSQRHIAEQDIETLGRGDSTPQRYKTIAEAENAIKDFDSKIAEIDKINQAEAATMQVTPEVVPINLNETGAAGIGAMISQINASAGGGAGAPINITINTGSGGSGATVSGHPGGAGAVRVKDNISGGTSGSTDNGIRYEAGEDDEGNKIYITEQEKKSREMQGLIDSYNAAKRSRNIAIRDSVINAGATIAGLSFGAGMFDELSEISTAGYAISEPIVKGSTYSLTALENRKIRKGHYQEAVFNAGDVEAVANVKISPQFTSTAFDAALDKINYTIAKKMGRVKTKGTVEIDNETTYRVSESGRVYTNERGERPQTSSGSRNNGPIITNESREVIHNVDEHHSVNVRRSGETPDSSARNVNGGKLGDQNISYEQDVNHNVNQRGKVNVSQSGEEPDTRSQKVNGGRLGDVSVSYDRDVEIAVNETVRTSGNELSSTKRVKPQGSSRTTRGPARIGGEGSFNIDITQI